MKHDIKFVKHKAGQFGIRQIKEDLLVKTATPGKTIPVTKKATEEDSMTQLVITYDTKTTVRNDNDKELEDDFSISSGLSVDSVDRKDIREFERKLEESKMAAQLEGTTSPNMALLIQMQNSNVGHQSTLSSLQNDNPSEHSYSHESSAQPVELPTLNRVSQEENETRRSLSETKNIHFLLT